LEYGNGGKSPVKDLFMSRKKILVVEDEQTTRRMLTFNLKQHGYDICEAEDGNTAYNLAQAEEPDLILLDIMMPGDNGFEVCKKIRATPKLADVPIVVLTARAGMADRKFAFKAGADDYLTKPINLQDLNARIDELLAAAEPPAEKVKPPDPGQIVAVFSPQRKMGTTTLAVRLSQVVSNQNKHPVVLIDLALPIGDVAPWLSLSPRKHIKELLSLPTAQISIETIRQYMQEADPGFQVIPAPAAPTGFMQKPTSDNLTTVLDLLIDNGYLAVLDLGSALTELNLVAMRKAQKVFTLTSGQPAANEAVDNFLILARKLGLDLAKLMPVVNQLQGPVGNQIVLVRSPVARVPYMQDKASELSWSNELAMKKLHTIIAG